MAVSELHNRLEHLVSYSSQLIFVSGETIGEQQQSLQAFLGQQSETAEIAFINAKVDTYEQQYRRQISRQLLGEESGLFNRPLNELLASLNHYEGPVLICICQAELLPPSFLQELWDLVLQCRFANNKQHLNVILFGKSAWAEQAKAWLPAKNRDKPVLLSNESITESVATESALDRLIAQKRQKFEERLIARAQPQVGQPSALSKWWFRGIIALAFLATFCGILLWQYSDAIPDIWAQSEATQPVENEPVKAAASEAQILQEPAVEIVESPTDQATEDMFSDQQLVTDWQTESEQLGAEQNQADELETAVVQAEVEQFDSTVEAVQSDNTIDIAEAANSPSAIDAFVPIESSVEASAETVVEKVQQNVSLATDNPESSTSAQTSEPVFTGEVEDYPVEDIVSVSQLPQPLEQQVQTEPTQIEITNTLAAAQVPESARDIERIQALSPTDFVIQIAGISSQQVLDEFVTDNNLSSQIWVYTTQRFGGDWHVVLLNQSFADLNEARQAIPSLASAMQSGTPFAKSVRQIQSEINQ